MLHSTQVYLQQRLAMMDYPYFQRRGYPIGSGSVESAHKQVVQRRLKGAGIVSREAEKAKVIASGKISRAVKVRGVKVTPGARKAIEAAGGSVEE